DLLDGRGFHGPLLADQAQSADAHPIRERKVFAIRLPLPPRCLVLHRAVIMLKTRGALLARFLLSTILVEAGHREPGPICTGLTGLGVEAGGKGEVFGELGAGDLQVLIAHAAFIHPLAQTRGTRMNCTVRMASSMACCWA